MRIVCALVILALAVAGSCAKPPDPPVNRPATRTATAPAAMTEPAAPRHQLQGPIQALAWEKAPAGTSNIAGLIRVEPGVNPMAIAKRSQESPPGQAGLLLMGWDADVFANAVDRTRDAGGASTGYLSPWFDHGIAATRQKTEKFFQEFSAAGGRADSVVMDMEGGVSYCRVTAAQTQAIFADPRFAAWQARYNIPGLGAVLAGDILNYNAALMDATAQALNQAIFDVATKNFPNVSTSNYDMYAMNQANVVPDSGGYKWVLNSGAGNGGAPMMYGGLHFSAAPDGTPYTNTAYHTVLWETNVLRGILNSSSSNVTPWLAFKGYADSRLTNSPYYDEMVYHLALSGASGFLLWNPHATAGQNPAQFASAAQDRAFDTLLQTLNSKFKPGIAVRTPITTQQMGWNDPLVVSGVQIGDTGVLWRITAPPGVKQVKVVDTGEVLNLNGAAGVWYESAPGTAVKFTAQ